MIVRETDGRQVAWTLRCEADGNPYQLWLEQAPEEGDAGRPSIDEVQELLMRLVTYLRPPIRRIPVGVPDTLLDESMLRWKRRGQLE